jgi:hypothetical protein
MYAASGIPWQTEFTRSAIQCTTNIVMQRFAVYMASSLVLWSMVIRAALGLL